MLNRTDLMDLGKTSFDEYMYETQCLKYSSAILLDENSQPS